MGLSLNIRAFTAESVYKAVKYSRLGKQFCRENNNVNTIKKATAYFLMALAHWNQGSYIIYNLHIEKMKKNRKNIEKVLTMPPHSGIIVKPSKNGTKFKTCSPNGWTV